MSDRRTRSWLFAPGHRADLLEKVFKAGADEVILDLEDAVPRDLKARARELIAVSLRSHPCWVRVNRAATGECERDLEVARVGATGLRLPKVESRYEVEWVSERAPGLPLDCSIETARGVLNVREIAETTACKRISYGGVDLALDRGIGGGDQETLMARSQIVLAARAAGKPAPSDGVHVQLRDDDGLRTEAQAARRLGFFGKSAIHPRQVPIINDVFSPQLDEIAWARRVLKAFEASGGSATTLDDREFVDEAVALRARSILDEASDG